MGNASLSLVAVEERDRPQTQLELTMKVMLLSRRWRAKLAERLKSVGQTDARWSTLHCLAEVPHGVIQNELAERVGVAGPSLVKLIDALEAQGLVCRRSSPGDRRAKVVQMLPEGEKLLAELDRIAGELRDEMFEGLTAVELETSLFVLSRVAARLK
jgi:MarR family transcriptional regulator, transcriptional regulator for hemolysin